MESLGKKLKTAREELGWDYNYICNETNISSRYLDALEREDFSVFPGEPYALGFLKNYGEFLGLDTNILMSLYRSQMKREQPAPIEQLLKKPSPMPKIIIICVSVLGVLAIAAGAFFFIQRLPRRNAAPPPVARPATEFVLSSDFLERRFYPGDSILVQDGTNSYRLLFASLGDAVTITTPIGPVMLDLGQEVSIYLDNNEFHSLRIFAADFVKNDSVSGALLRFEQEIVRQMVSLEDIPPMEDLGFRRDASTVLLASPNAFPFTLQVAFQGFCLFRHEVLFERNRPDRIEQFYQRAEEINIIAQNGIRMGISNAQAVRMQVIAQGRVIPFEAGNPGEVIAADLRWLRDEDNQFRLVFLRLE